MYCSPSIIIGILQNRLNLSYDEIITTINNFNVNLEERPGAKQKLEELNARLSRGYATTNQIDYAERMNLYSDFTKYQFEPFTLEYFINYIGILKEKCFLIISIIDGLIDQSLPKTILEDLDINLSNANYISMTDIYRLIDPLIYNFEKLRDMTKRANQYETYLTFKLSLDSIYEQGLYEEDLYPRKELQNSNYELDGEEGYIPYTDNQKKLMRKKENEIVNSMCDIEKNLK